MNDSRVLDNGAHASPRTKNTVENRLAYLNEKVQRLKLELARAEDERDFYVNAVISGFRAVLEYSHLDLDRMIADSAGGSEFFEEPLVVGSSA